MYAAVYAYPWDSMDETPDRFCATASQHMGVDTVSMAVTYHAAKLVLPHNPLRRVYYPDDGALYFAPDSVAYAGLPIQPHVSQLARDGDPLADLCAATQRAGMAVIAWTVCLHNSRLATTYPQFAPRTAHGDHLLNALCPAQSAVRAYICALVGDLARRYPLRAIQLEAAHALPFVHGYHHEMQQVALTPAVQVLLGLCFCDACRALAAAAGVDGARVQRYVADEIDRLLADPTDALGDAAWLVGTWQEALGGDLARYMALRGAAVHLLVSAAVQAAHAVSTVDVHVQDGAASGAPAGMLGVDVGWLTGLTMPPAAGDGVTVLGYVREADQFERQIRAYRALIPADMPLEIGLRPCPPDCDGPDNLAAKVALCRAVGAAGVSFYNYGMMPLRAMEWVRRSLEG